MSDKEYPVDHVDLDELSIHQPLPETRFSIVVEALVERLGEAISWCWVILLLVVVLNVTMRYVFGEGRIEFEELQWHIYSAGFLLGLSYTYVADDHIRVDVLRERMSPMAQAWVELYGTLLLMLPFLLLMVIYSIPFVAYSFEMSEISEAPGGLPMRWLVKSLLPIGFLLLLLATLARLSRLTSYLFGIPAPVDTPPAESAPTAKTSPT